MAEQLSVPSMSTHDSALELVFETESQLSQAAHHLSLVAHPNSH